MCRALIPAVRMPLPLACLVSALAFTVLAQAQPPAAEAPPPNVVIVFADDLGYGDLASYGHPTIRTPHLDRLAREGQRWTDFYAAASVCTPSRAGLLTGRLPIRSGMASDVMGVLFPNSLRGLPPEEITLAEQLRGAGYTSACIGKWHLGHRAPHLPTAQGFDRYFGIPYSNDMNAAISKDVYRATPDDSLRWQDYDVPLMRDTAIVERPADQSTITARYTDEAIDFIRAAEGRPFFVYLAHSLPHIPLFVGSEFRGTSRRGLYGDVVEEIDAGVGRLMAALEEEGLADNTIVVFTSDNGPWLSFGAHGGSAGLLRAGKGTTFEGGMREPCIVWGPAYVTPGEVHALGSTLDLFATLSAIVGVPLPQNRPYDSYDLSGVWRDPAAASPRESLLYYQGAQLYAARVGRYKVHYKVTDREFASGESLPETLVYDLWVDPGEQYPLDDADAIRARVRAVVEERLRGMVPGEDQLAERE